MACPFRAKRIAPSRIRIEAALDDAIAKLAEQRATAQRALEQARTSTAEQWEQVEQRTYEVLKNIEDAYQAAASKLRR